MLVIVIASQKGGSGKTTLSGHLAVEAERAGAGPVALIDTDPQGSLSQWWNARAEKSPAFAEVGAFDLESALQHLKRQGIRLAVIDTPPGITDAISHVIAHADLVIVPTRPSPHDLRAVGPTVDLAERHKRPLIFVVNGATARARITGEAAVTLSQHGRVAPVTIHNRVDFAASMVDGRTVGEVVAKSQSAKEVADLWIYVQTKLARLTKDPTLSSGIQQHHFSVSTSLGSSDETEPLELPPVVVSISGGASLIGDAERATNGAAHPVEAQPWGSIDLTSAAEWWERPRGAVFFSVTQRQANSFGRRKAGYCAMVCT